MARQPHSFLRGALLLMLTSVSHAQTPPTPGAPDFKVEVFGYVVEDFSTRVANYLELRAKLEEGLPPLLVTDDPADIEKAELALARRIRRARGSAQSQIFTPAIADEFRRVLSLEMTAGALAAIEDDNPGRFSHRINGTYPKERPVSTVPANLLALLPRLPGDIQYRCLGRHLVLHDTRANVILDRVRCAIRCQ